MSDPTKAPAGSEPPPLPSPNLGTYKNPRRTSPENSITLRHHRLAREASKRHASAVPHTSHPPRRKSSGESNETALSDARKWFDTANLDSKGNLDMSGMDVDPPFYQKETDSSNEEPVPSQSPAYRLVQNRNSALRPSFTQSSSADDYRSVIDDLTIENKRLKDELKRYRQMGPGSMQRDKLFEVKVHGLPSRKKRELEAALRDFTTSLDGSSTGEPSSRRKGSSKSKNISFLGDSKSKNASSSSGSNWRPVDSAYASMSGAGTTSGAGTSSYGRSLAATGKAAKQRSDLKIEQYLRDIPEGLWPRTNFMTEKDRKKLVVKRLEHLFTGKMGNYQGETPRVPTVPAPVAEDDEMETKPAPLDDKDVGLATEASREAKIRLRDTQQTGDRSRDNGSASNEHSNGDGDQTDSRDISGSGSGQGNAPVGNSGQDVSPQGSSPKQRPTRPRDLDPDRQQNPSENMDYIRHLGLVAPESKKEFSARDVSPDAEGWVYLNLLCNLAQLHMFNVTPDFIRSAVTEKSTKFQLSPDGRKIRWRGGEEGTKFSSDNSGRDSQRSQSSEDTDGSNDQSQRKKQKTSNHNHPNFKPQTQARQDSNSSESFHYKPLFVRHNTSSSDEPSGGDESGSYGAEESNLGHNSRWGQSGVSGFSQRKRRRDGAIIYYSGAPFCTDLSGDYSEVSPPDTGYDLTSSGDQGPLSLDINRPELYRSSSGSTLPYRPLGVSPSHGAAMDVDDSSEPPELTSGETDIDEVEANFEWSDSQQQAPLLNMEASGLAGVYPEDHFVVVVSTKRPKEAQVCYSSDDGDSVASERPKKSQRLSQKTTDLSKSADSIATKLATMSTTSPQPRHRRRVSSRNVKIEYVARRLRRLPPVPLPPPAFFYDDSNSDGESSDGSDGLISRQVMLEEDSSPPEDFSGNDEEDEHSEEADHSDEAVGLSDASLDNMEEQLAPAGLSTKTSSSLATAGGAQSGGSSLEEFP